MDQIDNKQMALILSIDTHRKEYPVVRWIEENIASGKADTDYGDHCKELIQEASVRFIEPFEYEVVDGKVTRVIVGWKADPFFEDVAAPKERELDLLAMCDPGYHGVLKRMSLEMLAAFKHPHSCSLEYHIMEDECCGAGCEKRGPVNYLFNRGNWGYFCGGSPRCCP